MPKISLTDLASLTNEQSAIGSINANNAAIETASDTFLSRDGTSPNTMESDLDMNSHRIINLVDPTSDQEPVTLGLLNDTVFADLSEALPNTISFVTLGTSGDLANERVLTAGTGISLTDGGAGSTITVSVGSLSSANLATALTDETGSGSVVFATSPTLVTPLLGTPTSGTLTNCTGLPVSTGVSGLASGVADFLGTPSSANLKTAVTDETGSGALVFANTPTLVTPVIGAATGTSLLVTGNLGFGTGAGGTVTQATSKSTGVTLNTRTGQITMNNAALAAGAEVSFTVTNSVVASTDVIIINHGSAGTAGAYDIGISAVGSGSFSVTVTNLSAGSLGEAIVLNFAVIKGVSS